MILKSLFIFVLVALVNFLWAKYINHIAKENPIKAASYGTAISLVGNLVTIVYISDHRMVIPAALATFVGTYFSVKFGNKKI